MRFLVLAFFCLPLMAQYKVASSTLLTESEHFEFHLSFWVNLHHTLMQNGKLIGTDREPKLDMLPSADQEKWRSAALFYKHNVPEDPLDPKAIGFKSTIVTWDNPEQAGNGLPTEMKQALVSAAPVYRSLLWKKHAAVNEKLLMRLMPILRMSEGWMKSNLPQMMKASWPKQKVRVDLAVTGHWAPGYTTLKPDHIMLLTGHPRIREELYALEILFHETAHLMKETFERDLYDSCRRAGMAPQQGLAHAILFYTTGEAMKKYWLQNPRYNQSTYQTYAERYKLYVKTWPKIHPLLQKHWQGYLDGKLDYQIALTEIVGGLK